MVYTKNLGILIPLKNFNPKLQLIFVQVMWSAPHFSGHLSFLVTDSCLLFIEIYVHTLHTRKQHHDRNPAGYLCFGKRASTHVLC